MMKKVEKLMKYVQLFEQHLSESSDSLKQRIFEVLLQYMLPKNSKDKFLRFVIENKITMSSGEIEIKLEDWDQVQSSQIEKTIFSYILPSLEHVLAKEKYDMNFLTRTKQDSYEIMIRKRTKPSKIKIGQGYHYTNHPEKIMKEGLIPSDSYKSKWSTSPFDDRIEIRGLWPGKRTYFYISRDDEDAKTALGSQVIPVLVDLKGIELFKDEDYLGDEDEIVAVWTNDVVPPSRLTII
jgi:hypothetical protein